MKFSEIGNTVFFWVKKFMKIWYLLITEKFLFWTFQRQEIWTFLSQKNDGKMIFIDYWKVLVLNFLVMGNISQKVNGKMIFTWSFWALHDIPGLGKYDFLCSDRQSCIHSHKKRKYSLEARAILLIFFAWTWNILLF